MGIFGNNNQTPSSDDSAAAPTPADPQANFGSVAPVSPVVSPTPIEPSFSQTAPAIPEESAPTDYIATDSPAATPAFPNLAPVTDSDPTPIITNGGDDLALIKKQALQQLSPLVGHLDQSSEERFRTTMMMLQATDDQNLISTAYDAAQGIADVKIKAQALLDIVNEINYFSQQGK